MSKTIKQIADEIGVSKQSVYKRYKGKLHTVCAPYAHTEQGILYIEEQGETLIKQDFLAVEHSNGAAIGAVEHSNGAHTEQLETNGIISVLQTTIDTLQEQLKVKDRQLETRDKQIDQQSKTIENLSSALAAAQALHAGTIQRQLIEDGTNPAIHIQEPEVTVREKGSWFSRLFGK